MKHVEVDCYFIKEAMKNKSINTPYLKYDDQLADIFTKILG